MLTGFCCFDAAVSSIIVKCGSFVVSAFYLGRRRLMINTITGSDYIMKSAHILIMIQVISEIVWLCFVHWCCSCCVCIMH